MIGGLGSYIASEISGSVRRNLTIYGLYGFGALLTLCAAGYGLNALHTVIALRQGAVFASLAIGGGLLLVALISFGVALYLKRRPRPSRPMAQTALVAVPIAARLLGSKLSWRTALVGGVVVLGAIIGRRFLAGGDDGEDEA